MMMMMFVLNCECCLRCCRCWTSTYTRYYNVLLNVWLVLYCCTLCSFVFWRVVFDFILHFYVLLSTESYIAGLHPTLRSEKSIFRE